MMKMQEAYGQGEKKLIHAGIAEARLDAWYLLEHVTGISRAMYYAMPEKLLSQEQEKQYADYIERRSLHIPLQHLTGVQEFMGLKFRVNEHVLIPRQDTETAVEVALGMIGLFAQRNGQKQDCFKLLDMCTGSGCILLSILHYAGKQMDMLLVGTGADISGKALEVARANAEALRIPADFRHSDLFSNVDGTYEMIISNPPYIRTGAIELLQEEVKAHDPWVALDGKEDGLYFYRRIIKEAGSSLKKGGVLIFEIGSDQGSDVQAMMQNAGYRDILVKKDLAGLDRVVIGVYDR